ncbi:MAG: LCP family protein [Ruminococcus sp.]|nr:LCP family protein [Ruminococcus sp.]
MAEKKKLTKKQMKLRRKRRRRRIVFALEIIILLVLIAGLVVFAKMGKMDFAELDFSNIGINEGILNNETMHGYTTIACVGLDLDSNGGTLARGNSDTMIIASINNDTKKVRLVSVYRDTYLRVGEDEQGNGEYGKANSAYQLGGAEQLLSMMNTNLDLNVQDFVTVDFNAVATVAELLGGIDMELKAEEVVHLNSYCVETSEATGMSYEKLEEVDGVQHLNGVQTVAYARIRYTSGNDFRRAARQRAVIYALVAKAKNADLATLNAIVDEVFPMIRTSLTKTEIIKMGMAMISYDIEEQTGFPFDHLYGENVKNALDGCDAVLPVTLESNVIKLHEFLYDVENYEPSEAVKSYSQRIIDKSGYGLDSQLEHSEDGSLAAYHAAE